MSLLVRQGCTPIQAAKLEGVGSSTFHEWRQRAKDEPDSIFARLFEAMEQAQIELGALAVGVVIKLLEDDDPRVRLQAAKLYLERRFPDEWGSR